MDRRTGFFHRIHIDSYTYVLYLLFYQSFYFRSHHRNIPINVLEEWVVVEFKKHWYPSEVLIIEDREIGVKCMKKIGNKKKTFRPQKR